MSFRIVQSKQNSRLRLLRNALTHPLRERSPSGAPLAGIEGFNLLEEAVRAGLGIPAVFVAEGSESVAEGLSFSAETELLLVSRDLLDTALTTESPQPVAALVEPPVWTKDDLLAGDGKDTSLIVVLASLQDPGNVGTVLRSAEAFGATGVISLPGTVSTWNPKALRASAGSAFRIPMLSLAVDDAFTLLREAGARIWTTALNGGVGIHQANLAAPAAILIGNEGSGVPAKIAAKADGVLTIPCPGPVESLNAAVAAGVILYEAARQRGAKNLSGRRRA